MAKMKFTVRSLEALKPPASGQVDYWDTSGPGGFGIRISQGGAKSFFLAYRRGGKAKRWTIGRFPSTTLAEAYKKAKKTDANHDDPVGRRAELKRAGAFKDLAAQFFEANEGRLKSKTAIEWKRINETELLPHFGEMKPHNITRGDIRTFLDEKAKAAPYMANRILEVIRRIYSWGVDVEKVAASPCVGLKKPGVEKQRERVLSTVEIRKVLKAIDQERPIIAGFFRLALLTGARRGEILGAKWADIDFEEKLWTVPDIKNNTAHTLPLSPAAAKVLQGLYPLAGHSEHVFLGPTGRAIQNPQKAVERLRKNTKIEFRAHDLRRTVATGLARLGVPHEVISAVLNHVVSGPQATRIYERHGKIPEMRRALDRWARELERIRTGAEKEKVVSIIR